MQNNVKIGIDIVRGLSAEEASLDALRKMAENNAEKVQSKSEIERWATACNALRKMAGD